MQTTYFEHILHEKDRIRHLLLFKIHYTPRKQDAVPKESNMSFLKIFHRELWSLVPFLSCVEDYSLLEIVFYDMKSDGSYKFIFWTSILETPQ